MLDKYDAYNLFENLPDLEMATWLVRKPTSTPGAVDIFESIPLSYVKRRPATRKDFRSPPDVILLDEYLVFMVFQYDLDINLTNIYSPSQTAFPVPPDPQVSYGIVDQTGGSVQATTSNNSFTGVITGLTSTDSLRTGMGVVAQGVFPGTTIQSIDSELQVTLNQKVQSAFGTIAVTFGTEWIVQEGTRHQTQARWDLTCKRAR